MSNQYVNGPARLRIGAGTAFKFGFFGALGLFVFYLLVSVVFGIIAAVVLAAGFWPELPGLLRGR